ncbi:MarR family winged helix-turn-helix transcriptional regulator [Nesterenkonia sp. NBAIMH1]|uniref:MarR family winged helix-turn-helix transcriptional regulator n=1 Tax=Nesterenkonia sp. NBAIMH1 TaxID=2600320 RepID=UPI0011B65085|nr:MarR family transcriptional regulator [Nesterenkonia sp. NBAIMH1]
MDGLERDPRGTPATERLNYSSYRLSRALDRFTENLALAHGVTLSQFLVMQVLAEGLPVSNAQLARRTFVSAQAAHSVLEELLKADLVARSSHPQNRRVRLVRLTEAGWTLISRCYAELEELESRLTERLDAGAPLVDIVHTAAEALAGGYFGDDEAEAEAVAQRAVTNRPRHVPSRLAAARLRQTKRRASEAGGDPEHS